MYDELVKRLRSVKDSWQTEEENLMLEAADAIEEQQAQIDGWIEQERNALLKSISKWIPVTERLPEHDMNVLICYEWTGRSGTVYTEVGIASIEELERDPTEMFRPLYWMPLPVPPKEE